MDMARMKHSLLVTLITLVALAQGGVPVASVWQTGVARVCQCGCGCQQVSGADCARCKDGVPAISRTACGCGIASASQEHAPAMTAQSTAISADLTALPSTPAVSDGLIPARPSSAPRWAPRGPPSLRAPPLFA